MATSPIGAAAQALHNDLLAVIDAARSKADAGDYVAARERLQFADGLADGLADAQTRVLAETSRATADKGAK